MQTRVTAGWVGGWRRSCPDELWARACGLQDSATMYAAAMKMPPDALAVACFAEAAEAMDAKMGEFDDHGGNAVAAAAAAGGGRAGAPASPQAPRQSLSAAVAAVAAAHKLGGAVQETRAWIHTVAQVMPEPASFVGTVPAVRLAPACVCVLVCVRAVRMCACCACACARS